jgi:hypothetical protein
MQPSCDSHSMCGRRDSLRSVHRGRGPEESQGCTAHGGCRGRLQWLCTTGRETNRVGVVGTNTFRPAARSRDRVCKYPLLVAAVMAAAQAVNAAPASQVLTESGAISGISERGLSVYKGVPFAAPPVGDLRWRAPAAVAPWTGIRGANAFAAACMQEGVSMPGETPPPEIVSTSISGRRQRAPRGACR